MIKTTHTHLINSLLAILSLLFLNACDDDNSIIELNTNRTFNLQNHSQKQLLRLSLPSNSTVENYALQVQATNGAFRIFEDVSSANYQRTGSYTNPSSVTLNFTSGTSNYASNNVTPMVNNIRTDSLASATLDKIINRQSVTSTEVEHLVSTLPFFLISSDASGRLFILQSVTIDFSNKTYQENGIEFTFTSATSVNTTGIARSRLLTFQ